MKKLAYWAHQHPRPARGILIICRIMLAILGLCFGLLLAAGDHFPVWPLALGSIIPYLIALSFYPLSSNRSNFYRRKVGDGLLVVSTGLFYICAGNWLAEPVDFQANAAPLSGQRSVLWSSLERPSDWTITGTRHQMLKKIKKAARQGVREIRAARAKLGVLAIIGLIFLSLLLMVFLGSLTLGIACHFSCNGQEGLATLTAVFGTLFTLSLVIFIWHTALRNSARQKPDNR